MKHIDFEFNDRTYALSFTAEALFTVYDKFGYTADILGTTKVLEPTVEGWKNLCWLAALMASQGELPRRNRGEDPQPMLTVEEVQRTACPMDVIRMRAAIREAYFKGFERETASEEEEIDLGLLELQKKTAPASPDAGGSASRPSFLAFLFGKR